MSTRSGNRGKHKRSVQTTLGKAPHNTTAETIDLSHLRRPIDTSIFGLSQILSLFSTATDEVRRYIAYECELMFECRICRTVFRSVANFVLHKRNYCQEIYSPINSNNKADFEDNGLTIVNKDSPLSTPHHEEPVDSITETPTKRYPTRNLSAVLKKLSDKQECQKYTESILNEELTERSYIPENKEDALLKTVCLEGIDNNPEGVFQTMDYKQTAEDLMKSEVMEIHSILNTNEAILGPDGKVFTFKRNLNDTFEQKLICTICSLKFATKKTLTHHIKYKHNDTRIVYVCPECKDNFANAWCVFRHLYKVHRKTSAQIRRMRDQIHSSTIIKKQEPLKKRETENEYEFDSRTNDGQPCEGCGKRFDRKAAQHSHLQTCLKRLAVALAKENQKNMQEEKMLKQKMLARKGSSKRKPDMSQRILRRSSLEIISEQEELTEVIDEIDSNESPGNDSVEIIDDEQVIDENPSSVSDNGKKDLVQETIIGSRESSNGFQDSSLSKSFVGFVSDEEEILGFMKRNEMALGDNATNTLSKEDDDSEIKGRLSPLPNETHHGSIDCIFVESNDSIKDDAIEDEVKIEETTIHPNIKENVENLIELDQKQILKDDILIESDDASDNTLSDFPKVPTPRQYASKKHKRDPTPISNVELKKKKAADDLIVTNNNVNISEIDLPYSTQNNTTECDPLEITEISSSSDSDSCSCFDERSHDSSTSFDSNRAMVAIQPMDETSETLDNIIGNSDESRMEVRGTKRKISIELEEEQGPECLLREKCNDYVDWDSFTCRSCYIAFLTEAELLKHMALHFNWFQFQCNRCNFMSYDEDLCKEHTCDNSNEETTDIHIVPLPLSEIIHIATDFNISIDSVKTADDVNKRPDANEPSLTCNADTIKTQDPSLRKMIMEVIFGPQEVAAKTPAPGINSRPIRNRISIRSVQKDFEFDMKRIDSKMRKTLNESKVKPIKIVKNNDLHFVVNSTGEDLPKKKRSC